MATTRNLVVIPEIFTPYVDEAIVNLSPFYQSGIVQPMEELNVDEGGDYVNVPFWKLNLSGDAQVLTDSTSMSTQSIGSGKQLGVVLHRGQAWEGRDLAKLAAGSDPMAAVGRGVAQYTMREIQKDLFSICQGVFGPLTSNTTGALKALSIDSNSTATALGPRQVAKARAALGEQGEKLSKICMPSLQYFELVERRAIDYVTAAEVGITPDSAMPDAFAGSMQGAFTADTRIPFYMGMQVLYSDDMPTDGTNYMCVLFQDGAIGSGQQAGFVSETDRDVLALSDVLATHWHNVLHPVGMAYNNTAAGPNPTRTALATASNWSQVYETKNLGMAAIIVNPSF